MSGEVQKFWERQAVSYTGNYADRARGANHNFRTRLALAVTLTRGRGGILLDCATGSGEITEAVLTAGGFAGADIVDIAQPMLEASQRRLSALRERLPIRWACADVFSFLESQPREPRYGLVLCLGLIAHTGRLETLLRLCAERLAPGGAILLQTSLLDHPGFRFLAWFSARRHARKKGYEMHFYSQEDIREAVRAAGLAIRESRRFAVGIPYGDRICPALNHRLERAGERWAARHGMDALYLLERP